MWDQNDRPKAHFLSATNDLTGRRHHRWWLILWQKLKITKHVITSHSHNIDITIFPCHKIYQYIYIYIYVYMFASMFSRSIQFSTQLPALPPRSCSCAHLLFLHLWKGDDLRDDVRKLYWTMGFWGQESTRKNASIGFYWILLDINEKTNDEPIS